MALTRYTHSILFFFAIALALLCSAVLMLYLNQTWADADFTALVTSAAIVSLVIPAAAALASLRLIRWHQPVIAWLIFFLILAGITFALGYRLLD